MTSPQRSTLSRIMLPALIVGVVGAVLCAGAALVSPGRFFPAYLVAFLFWTGIGLGSLGISMLHHLTGGGWGLPIRRILESSASTLLLMGILFLPLIIGMPHLYSWSDQDVVARDEILQRKEHYLNVNFFLLRAAVYFGIWIIWSLALNWGSGTSDKEVQLRRARPLALFSGWGLALWGLSVTFAAVDWGMSLEPHWFSSMYGVLFMGGQAVSALAWSIIVALALPRASGSMQTLNTARLHDLGNFMLAFVMFWSYVSFMQFLIIWSANLPEETPWYLLRSQGGWQVVVAVLMCAHFLLPFLLLLMRQIKRVAKRMVAMAAWLLCMRLIDLCWLVMPPFVPSLIGGTQPAVHGHGPATSTSLLDLWPLLLTVPTIGGLWLAMFAWTLSQRARMPVFEYQEPEETRHAVAHSP